MVKRLVVIIFLGTVLLVSNYGFSDHVGPVPEANHQLVVYCSTPSYLNIPLIQEFEKTTGIKVEVVQQGAGGLFRRLEKEREVPVADVLWTGSLNMAKEKKDLFADYRSSNEPFIKPEFQNKEGYLTRFTEITNVIIVNTKLIGDIPVNGYEDLLNPALEGKIAFADPGESSIAYEHLVNMLYAMGNGDPETGWSYVQRLCKNVDGKILRTADAVYQGVADGEFVVGCTFEETGLATRGDAPLKLVYMKEGVISRADGLSIIRHCRNQANAQRFVDFMTSKNTQTFIAEKFYRRSVRDDVKLAKAVLPKQQMTLISANEEQVLTMRTAWLERFNQVIMRD